MGIHQRSAIVSGSALCLAISSGCGSSKSTNETGSNVDETGTVSSALTGRTDAITFTTERSAFDRDRRVRKITSPASRRAAPADGV